VLLIHKEVIEEEDEGDPSRPDADGVSSLGEQVSLTSLEKGIKGASLLTPWETGGGYVN